MILIPYILHVVGLWVRPGGIGELFLALVCNYDLALISHSTFIIDISVSSSLVRIFLPDVYTHVRMK